MLENKDEREEIDEPSHAERPLTPFLRPPLSPPELRPTAPVVGPKLHRRRRPQPYQHSMRLPSPHHRSHPRGGGGGRHLHRCCCHPHGCGPRGRDCRCVAFSPDFVLPTLPPGFGQKTVLGASSWAISRALTRARVGAALICPAYGVQYMRVQAASTERASTCHDAGLSDVRKAEAVSTTAVANAGENSRTLGADAMHATLPLKKAASPGCGRWDATPCGRVEGEGATTGSASRAAVFACSISSSNRRRRASRRRIVWLASSSARLARAAAYAKSKGPAWVSRSREPWEWRSAERGEPRWRRWCPVERGGGEVGGAPPGLARPGVETPPSPVEVGPSCSLREPASRPPGLVGPGGGMVVCLLSRHRNPPPVIPPVSSRGISSELSLSRGHPGWGAEDLSLPRVARFLTGRHVVAYYLWGGQRNEGVWGKVVGWERRVKKQYREICCCGVPAASSGISVFQETARYGPQLRPVSVMVAATPSSRIKGEQPYEGCHPPKPQHKSSSQFDRRVYG